MIAHVKGTITHKAPARLIVETTGGVGYEIFISLHTYRQIHERETLKILTHHHVKEDAQTLFGFAEDGERGMFRHLLSVSGIGPNTAIAMLSSMSPEDIRAAIIGENVNAIKAIKGIGPKTAKRVILDLKDKLMKDGGGVGTLHLVSSAENKAREEALAALVNMGINRIAAQKRLNAILKTSPNATTEEMIVAALRDG